MVVAAVDLWAKKVSYRQIADHLRGVYLIPVTKSTIERWVKVMRNRLALYADSCGPAVGDIWHADETMTNVDGSLRYVWNVMDRKSRYWLASTFSEGRKVGDARRALRKAKSVAMRLPRALITDGYPAYGEAVRKELYSNTGYTNHFVIPPIRRVVENRLLDLHPGNNAMERLQEIQRELTRGTRGFGDLATAQNQVDGYRGYYNLVRPHSGMRGMTPAQCAGVPTPILRNEGLLMACLVAGYRLTNVQ